MKKAIRLNGVIVGHIVRKDYVTKRRSEHFFFKHHGFGISKSILRTLVKNRVENIIIDYKGKKESFILKTEVRIWLTLGKKVKEKGYDEQYILDMDYMEKICLE